MDPRALDELHERRAGTVGDGDLGAFHFDASSVDPAARQSGEDVLDGADPHAVAAQRGVQHRVHDGSALRRNLERRSEIGPHEDDAAVRAGRRERQADRLARVQPDAFDGCTVLECPLVEGLAIHRSVGPRVGAAAA